MSLQITVGPTSPILTTTGTQDQGTFTQKLIDISIRLAASTGLNQPNSFSASGTDTVTLSGFRTLCRIRNAGTPAGSEAEVRVFGLGKDLMDELSTLGMVINLVPRNALTILAGDAETGKAVVFTGTILQAYGEFNSSPQVPMYFECKSGIADDVIPAPPSSFTGPTDVATAMSSIATKLGYGFENSGVQVSVSNPYLAGSYGNQWKKLARDAGINAALVNGGASSTSQGLVLAIWPKNGSRGIQAPLIAAPPEGAMIGYPSYTQQGIMVRNVFNPQVGFGGNIVVKSKTVTKANGTWTVHKMDHSLDSLVEKGLWESSIYGYSTNSPTPVLTPR